MSIAVSGYTIIIPLGMWVEIEARFMMVKGRIDRVYAVIVDSVGGITDLIPNRVLPLVDAYFESWLLSRNERSDYAINDWLDQDFWQDTTQERLEALVIDGLARELYEEG